jgi:Spy/CpxP family protein refolding chaperone
MEMKTLVRGALIGACILTVSGAGTAAPAQRGEGRLPDLRKSRQERMAEFLDLSERQIDQIKELREEDRSQRVSLRKEMLRIRNEIQGEMLEDSPDINRLKKLAARKGEVRTQMEVARLEHRLAMRDILTEEQRDKMFMRRGHGRRGGFREGGHEFGRGRMGPGGGPGFGMKLDDSNPDCPGFGPGPLVWHEG